jgi:hypothetical protein
MGSPTKENIFRGLLGVAATAATFYATGGSAPLLAVLAGLGSELGGEQLSHFIQKGYRAICGNNAISQPIEKAMQTALKTVAADIEQGWQQQNTGLAKRDKKNINNFLELFTQTSETELAQQCFDAANADAVFALLETDRTTGQLALDKAVSQSLFISYWQQQYALSDAFVQYFTTHFWQQFNKALRQQLLQGGEVKNALDLLYQQTCREQLAALLQKADSQQDKLDALNKALPQIMAQLAATPTDALAGQWATALKQALAAQQDALLYHLNPQPPLEYTWYNAAENDAVFRQRYLDYVEPTHAWQQLWDFYNKDSLLEWWLVTGLAGTGKSRLALEFCLALHQQSTTLVSAGFIGSDVLDKYEWWKNTPQRPWFIVIDYAGGRKDALQNALEGLRGLLNTGKLKHKVRLLLLDRTVPDDFTDSITRQLHLQLTGGSLLPYRPAPLKLASESLEEKAMQATAIFIATLAKTGRGVSVDELREYLLLVAAIDPLLRPLFVFFCANAIANG